MFSLPDVPHNVKFCPEFDPLNGYDNVKALTYDGMPIVTDEGEKRTKVFAFIGFPEKFTPTKNGKMPAVVLVHGGGGHAFAKWVDMWNKRGYAAIAMDTTGYFPAHQGAGLSEGAVNSGKWIHGPYGPFADDDYTTAPDNLGMKEGLPREKDRQWMYHAIADVMLARRLITSYDCVDEENTGVTGISWGGVITSLVIGWDDKFSFAVPVYGSGYIGDLGMGFCAASFTHSDVRKTYLAESRFDKVKMPVLWLCYNDDSAFSIQSNSRSYLDTRDNNPLTAISAVNKMGHSHGCGWNRPESMTYADAVTYGKYKLPRPGLLEIGDKVSCKFETDDPCEATLYYVDSHITYTERARTEGGRVLPYMDQTWKTAPCEINNGTVTCDKPEDAKGMYIELKCQTGGSEYIVTTEYIEI